MKKIASKIGEYIGGIVGTVLIVAMPLAVLSTCHVAHAQIYNPGAPTTAGTGLTKTGTALNVTYGTTSNTSTQGNDARVTGAAQKVSNLSDLSSASSARTNLGLGTAATSASTDFLSSASTVTVPQGGTGVATNTNHGVLVGQGSSAIAATAAGTSGQPLLSGGTSADPAYGTLSVPSGGTGLTTIGADGILYGNGTSAIGVTGAGTTGQLLVSNGPGVAPTFQTIATGTGTVTSGLANQMAYYPSSAAIVSGNANATISNGVLTLGVPTSVIGTLNLSGDTSGTVSIVPQSAAGTYNFNLPTSAGTAGKPLLSGGGGGAAQTYGTLGVAAGGTGTTSITAHGLLIGNGTSAISTALTSAVGAPFLSKGTSTDPDYGTLTASFGGTGTNTNTAHGVLIGEGTSAVVATASGNAGDVLTSNGGSADPTFQAPAASISYRAVTTSQFDVTSNTTVAAVPGLSVTVPAGTFRVVARLNVSTGVTQGFKANISGTRTVTSQSITIVDSTDAAPSIVDQTTGTGGAPQVARTANTNEIVFDGIIVVSVGGTIIIQFAQNFSSGSAASVLINSYLIASTI